MVRGRGPCWDLQALTTVSGHAGGEGGGVACSQSRCPSVVRGRGLFSGLQALTTLGMQAANRWSGQSRCSTEVCSL